MELASLLILRFSNDRPISALCSRFSVRRHTGVCPIASTQFTSTPSSIRRLMSAKIGCFSLHKSNIFFSFSLSCRKENNKFK